MASHYQQPAPVAKVVAEARPKMLRSGIDCVSRGEADDSLCICCKGRHIFGTRIEFDGPVNGWGKKLTSAQDIVHQLATMKKDGVPIYEGKRIRLTVEVLDD